VQPRVWMPRTAPRLLGGVRPAGNDRAANHSHGKHRRATTHLRMHSIVVVRNKHGMHSTR
jgi:hypothetical protein